MHAQLKYMSVQLFISTHTLIPSQLSTYLPIFASVNIPYPPHVSTRSGNAAYECSYTVRTPWVFQIIGLVFVCQQIAKTKTHTHTVCSTPLLYLSLPLYPCLAIESPNHTLLSAFCFSHFCRIFMKLLYVVFVFYTRFGLFEILLCGSCACVCA